MAGLMTLWRTFHGLCWYCERLTWVEGTMSKVQAMNTFSPPFFPIKDKRKEMRMRRATREHLKRKAEGGIRTKDNIVLACNGCNSSRGVIPPNDWRDIRRGIKDGLS